MTSTPRRPARRLTAAAYNQSEPRTDIAKNRRYEIQVFHKGWKQWLPAGNYACRNIDEARHWLSEMHDVSDAHDYRLVRLAPVVIAYKRTRQRRRTT